MLLSLGLLSLCALAAANPAALETRADSPELSADLSFSVQAGTTLTAPDLPASLTITCSNCSLSSGASVSGGGGTTTPDSNFTVIESGFNFMQAWAGIAFDSYDFHVEVTFTGQLNTSTPFDVPITTEPKEFSVAGITLQFEPHLIGSLTTSTTVNFSIGFDVSTPAGAAILLPLANPTGLVVVGFNETEVTPVFLSPEADIQIDFKIALRTQFAFNLTQGTQAVSVMAFADTPSADVAVTQIINGDTSCNPSNGSDTFAGLTKVAPTLGIDAGAFLTGEPPQQINFTLPLEPLCLQYDQNSQSLVPPGEANGTSGSSGGNGGSGSNGGNGGNGGSGSSGKNTAGALVAPVLTILVALGMGLVLA